MDPGCSGVFSWRDKRLLSIGKTFISGLWLFTLRLYANYMLMEANPVLRRGAHERGGARQHERGARPDVGMLAIRQRRPSPGDDCASSVAGTPGTDAGSLFPPLTRRFVLGFKALIYQ